MKFLLVLPAMIVIYFALKYTIGKPSESFEYDRNKYILWFSLVCGIVLNAGINWYGNEIPGSIFERSKYETMLYVHFVLLPFCQARLSWNIEKQYPIIGNY